MNHAFQQRSVISIGDFNKEEILHVIALAEKMKKTPPQDLLRGKILANCFFEPSTRTRLSFESAMIRLGGQVIGFSDGMSTSVKKGESLQDSIRVIGQYADLIVLRHSLDGAARCASFATDKPVINAGDGSHQHPTQTLLDLFTIKECQGRLDSLNIALVGDLKYGRAAHSLSLACALFGMRLFLISPEQLTLPDEICHLLRKKGVKFSFHRTIEEVMGKTDILYMTRFQRERFDETTYEQVKNQYLLKESMLLKAQKHLRILHPLPRVNEIEMAIDKSPFAYYFEQAQNGLFVRQALLSLILNP